MRLILLIAVFISATVGSRAEDALAAANAVSIEVRLIQAPRALLDQLLPNSGYVLKSETLLQLQKLITEKKVFILAQPRITTLSGIQCQVKFVRELIYPAEYDQHPFLVEVNGLGGGQPWPPLPNPPSSDPAHITFMTREVGIILNANPTVRTDGKTIDLALTPNSTRTSGQDFIKHEIISPKGKTEVSSPDFYDWAVSTSVVLKSGTTVVLSVSDGPVNEKSVAQDNVVVALLTATVVSVE